VYAYTSTLFPASQQKIINYPPTYLPSCSANCPAGDLLSLTDGKVQTTRWNYDEYGRVTNKLDQAGTEIPRYKYDADSRLTNRWSVEKSDTFYAYDPVGNLTNIDYPVSHDVSFKAIGVTH
jgi:YD repeat-containing protein